MEGYLNKKSPKAVFGMRVWQQRYFILYTDRLLYKKTRDDQSDTGTRGHAQCGARPRPSMVC